MLESAYDYRWIDFAQNKGKDTEHIVQVHTLHIHMYLFHGLGKWLKHSFLRMN